MAIPTREEMYRALEERHGAELQRRLSAAGVAVCGLGGLGSNIAIHLARAGVGHLNIIDFDRVDISNLNRQQYFPEQLGQYKSDALYDTLSRIAPYCEIRGEYPRPACGLRYHLRGVRLRRPEGDAGEHGAGKNARKAPDIGLGHGGAVLREQHSHAQGDEALLSLRRRGQRRCGRARTDFSESCGLRGTYGTYGDTHYRPRIRCLRSFYNE